MEITIAGFTANVKLTGSEIIQALKSSDQKELSTIRRFLNNVEQRCSHKRKAKVKKHRGVFVKTEKERACLQCQHSFVPNGNAQKFCSDKCKADNKAGRVRQQVVSHNKEVIQKAMEMKPVPPAMMDTIGMPGHVTGKKYRNAENNPFE
jgi:hypothetical protein